MMQCRDIDELTVDYLYQELDATRTAEFETHVQGCARCGAEIGSLQRTRQAMRALPEAEPSPGVSTRLLHEASKRARRSSGGLFGKLAELLQPMAAHPAWAAVVTLVLVVGVTTALSVRGKAVGPRIQDDTRVDDTRAAAPAATPAPAEVAGERDVTENKQREVREADTAVPTPAVEKVAPPPVVAGQSYREFDKAAPTGRIATAPEQKPLEIAKKAPARRDEGANARSASAGKADADQIAASPARPASSKAAPKKEAVDDRAGGPAAGGDGAGAATATAPAAPPPAAQNEESSASADRKAAAEPQAAAPAPASPAAKDAEVSQEPSEKAFQQAQAEVKGGRCQSALTIVQKIQKMNPDFYRRRIAGDPTIESCAPPRSKAKAIAPKAAPSQDLERAQPADDKAAK